MTITTHEQHAAQFVVEYGSAPQRDLAKIAAYLKLRAERARRAKAVQAAATGPRADEWTGKTKPIAITQGARNPEASGCVPIEWKPPVGGRWEPYGMNGAERFVPDPAPAFTPAPKPISVTPPKSQEVEGTLTGTSATGMRTKPNFAPACGPAPIAWVDPAVKKER